MYKRIVIIPYNTGSGSAKRLRELLRQRLPVPVLIVPKGSKKYQPRWTDYVINWGCSKEWDWINLTKKDGNTTAVDKLSFFKKVQAHNDKTIPQLSVNVPEWTEDSDKAWDWLGDSCTVLARTTLTGHSGQGIIVMDSKDGPMYDAPLYVMYKKKRHEYRVHIFNGQVIDVTQKKKRKGFENVDTKIRNHKNGWIYAREDITEPDDLRSQAANAITACGLKFGAVDLIWNEKENKCYVLEINTAPGLFETTLKAYADAFMKDIQK